MNGSVTSATNLLEMRFHNMCIWKHNVSVGKSSSVNNAGWLSLIAPEFFNIISQAKTANYTQLFIVKMDFKH